MFSNMAIRILKSILFQTPRPKPSTFSTSSSPSSSSSNGEIPISTIVSVLTHQRSKSRWSNLRSLCPNGFNPHQFSQITIHLKNNPHLVIRFFNWTKQKSLCNHDLLSYSTVIHILARGRLKSQALVLIQEAFRVSGSEGESHSKPLKVFESLLKTYKQCGSAPFVFDLLIKACLETKKIDSSIKIVRMLLSRNIRPKFSTCNSLIRNVSQSRGAPEGYLIYKEIFGLDCESVEEKLRTVSRVNPNIETLNTLMVAFYQDGMVDMVKEIWDQLEELNCDPNGYSYSILMSAYCDEEKMDEAEALWDEMRALNMEPDVMAYNTIIGGFCRIGEIEKAEEFYREMAMSGVESTTTTLEHIISGYIKVGNIDSAVFVYKDMRRKDFRAEASTMDALIKGLCDKNRVFEALEILKTAEGHFGFCPTRKSFEILITGMCLEGNMEEALRLQAEMVSKGFKPTYEIYSAFISGYRKQGNVEMAELLKTEMLDTRVFEKED
ncbi:pentatricopeptide repeat-containing protein At2g15980 [Humulus lupulus]|uniref:pentatricopeptide repeat-containing protein At2g15980 n=1 Tax=Humulus lupulus TaxID=3486 RepID=UPI002B40CF2B|nr:pentatricopeptide repeat-containing protein At2g15980 [Humulus lupulus]XP_062095141.1 pentatricopeptide repeat-containing protein At2g15980 [Humulus lupulus]